MEIYLTNGKVLDGIFNQNNTTGGKLIFNLGNVSEDIMKDNLHAFENGLSKDFPWIFNQFSISCRELNF